MGGMEYYVANEKLDLKRGKTHRVKEGREIHGCKKRSRQLSLIKSLFMYVQAV